MTDKRDFGLRGEESAASFLCGKGFRIIGRNVKIGHTETDIIAENGKYIVFAEVKTRRTYPDIHHAYGRPASAVSRKKQEKLIEGAWLYLKRNADSLQGLQPRIDVVEVYVSPDAEHYKVLKIVHMENAVLR